MPARNIVMRQGQKSPTVHYLGLSRTEVSPLVHLFQ